MAGETILDIDDSPTVQRLIEMILSSQGYKVILASDGEEGIAKAKSERPALILVDFVMPKMNGFQVCKALKEDPDFRDTPIILVTSKGDKVGSKFVDVLGISEYFTKPFQPEELLAKIREVLDKSPVQAAPAAAPMAPAEPTPVRGVRREPTPARGVPGPSPAAPVVAEDMVRAVIERIIDELRRTVLPDLVRRELARNSSAAGTEQSESGIRGDLSSFRLVEVLQMLALQRQTGRLSVTGNGSGVVDIYFREGSVVFAVSGNTAAQAEVMGDFLRRSCRIDEASIQHALQVAAMTGDPIDRVLVRERVLDEKTLTTNLKRQTESVVFRAMAFSNGSFFFERSTPPALGSAVHLKVDDLLLEGARRSDEWVLIQQRIPNFDLVFEPIVSDAEELAERGLSAIDSQVLALVDGHRTVQEIIDELGLADFDVAKSLFILLSVNLVRQG